MKRVIVRVDFGEWMKEKRREKRLSQEQLANRVNCHTTSIGRWERGEGWPPLDITERIVNTFGAELVIREKMDEGE